MSEKLNFSFEIPLREIEDAISQKINGDFAGYSKVVSLRDLSRINEINIFKEDVFYSLIRNVKLKGTSNKPYRNSRIEVFNREPKGIDVGQTFVLESKLLSIMEGLSGKVFSGFLVNGLSKMPPVQVYGIDKNGEKALAFYIPAIVEIHNNSAILIDGMHRNYICGAAGTTTKAVHISEIDAEIPFEKMRWENVRVVKEKPPIEQRYTNLRRELFRDFSVVGIDG